MRGAVNLTKDAGAIHLAVNIVKVEAAHFLQSTSHFAHAHSKRQTDAIQAV